MPLLRHLAASSLAVCAIAQQPVTFQSLVGEMVDLERLTRLPDPPYRTVQFSSTDRRSTGIEQPGWFGNADGFGQEPLPGFEQVLQPPGADGVGEYLLCDVDGPGAIVRGWSAGMDGVLRVWLDGSDQPLFEGKGYDFLARRSQRLLSDFAGLSKTVQGWFVQEDADYLPIPFASHLRVTWRGSIKQLHFYHLQVRRYAAGTKVETFTPRTVAAPIPFEMEPEAWEGVPGISDRATGGTDRFRLDAGATWQREIKASAGGAELTEISATLDGNDLERVCRSLLLRISFDGSQRPQVETPLDAFIGAGTGMSMQKTAAVVVPRANRFTSTWRMPFASSCRIELVNHSGQPVGGLMSWQQEPRAFDDRSLHFHAKWRVDHHLHGRGGAAPIDLPFVTAIGQGRFVGLGCQLLNPPMDPRWRSNWWGEGDEKIFVDGKLAALGTGSEDYFNYSWSHWNLFAYPYCQQPLASGPGNCGYVANQRLQIVDDLPFDQSLAVALELWTHKPVTPLSYGRIAYWYARPGCIDDHRAIQPADLALPRLQPWPDDVWSKPGEATCARLAKLQPKASGGGLQPVPTTLSRSGELLRWQAPPDGTLTFSVHAPERARYRLNLLCLHQPGGSRLQAQLDGKPLRCDKQDGVSLNGPVERLMDATFDECELDAGDHEVNLRCAGGGELAFDTVHLERRGEPLRPLPGAVEAELWDLTAFSPGTEVEPQLIGPQLSSSYQRWVRAQKAGDFATFRVAAPKPGRYRVTLRLVQSWDYGILRVDWNGEPLLRDVDTFCGEPKAIKVVELDLGERDLSQPAELKFTVTGSNPKATPPRTYFGIDCVLLREN